MKKIIFAFSCVFLMIGAAVADGRYEIVPLSSQKYLIVDTKQGRVKLCYVDDTDCLDWKSWGK